MFSGILQKLNHKKAVGRLNLLRIVRSICDPSDDHSEGIREHPLFEAIQRLAETDNAVLVRNMASELVKSNLDKDSESGSGGRSRPGQGRRTSSYTPPSLHQSVSTPITPTHISRVSQSSAFIDGSVTPRRMHAAPNGNEILYRPRSRDGGQPQIARTGSELSNSASLSKSRLPRTSLLRASRSSMAAPSIRDEPTSSLKENGVRLREQSRSAASPAPGGTAPQLNSKRRTRQPSGDIKWS
jgi:hypothetical protein